MDKLDELKMYFNSLTTPQKKEFITKLKAKNATGEKYKNFLFDCVQAYNEEVRAKKRTHP